MVGFYILFSLFNILVLLLEPDNKTCSEFHAVICEKMKQGNDDDNSFTASNSSH